ncbi:MAG: hypothetical protein ACI97A_001957, partial [Planctomycetota bacterium]
MANVPVRPAGILLLEPHQPNLPTGSAGVPPAFFS